MRVIQGPELCTARYFWADSGSSSLSGLSNRREQGGKASADFLYFEAHSGSMQRKSREI
jgi:hypothetical protein